MLLALFPIIPYPHLFAGKNVLSYQLTDSFSGKRPKMSQRSSFAKKVLEGMVGMFTRPILTKPMPIHRISILICLLL